MRNKIARLAQGGPAGGRGMVLFRDIKHLGGRLGDCGCCFLWLDTRTRHFILSAYRHARAAVLEEEAFYYRKLHAEGHSTNCQDIS